MLQIIEEGLRVHQPTLSGAQREQQVKAVMMEVGLTRKHGIVTPLSFPAASVNVSPSPALILKPSLIILMNRPHRWIKPFRRRFLPS